MKRLFLIALFVGLIVPPILSQAQSKASQPKYVRYGKIPPFSMTAVGKKTFTNKDLKKGVPTMIFLFSVDCSHCQHEVKEIIKNIDKFKGTQLIMITPFEYKQMYAFYRGYGVQKHPDIITMGSDPTRRLNMFYQQKYYPGIYLYNKKGELTYHHEGSLAIDKLIAHLKE